MSDWDIVRKVAEEMQNTSMYDIDAEHIYGWATRLGELAAANDRPLRNCDRFRTVDDASDEYERLVEEGKAEDGTWGEWLFSVGQYAPKGEAK